MKGPWQHYVDWFVYPPLAVIIAALTCRSLLWVYVCLGGFVFWTFVEYWVHRIWLHKITWHSTHQRHHVWPQEYVVFPLWYLPAVFFSAFCLMFAAFQGGPLVWPFYTGFLGGYVWFMTIHHWLHHIDMEEAPAWLKQYDRWHNVHHMGKKANYGITHPFFDMLFRTYVKP